MKKYKWIFIILIWIIVLCCMLLYIKGTNFDVLEEVTVNSVNYQTTPLLLPNDKILFSLQPTSDQLQAISVAFVYDADKVEEDATATLTITQGDTVLDQQIILLSSIPSSSFSTYNIPNSLNNIDTYVIEIKNTSFADDSFAFFYTDKDINYFDNLSSYQINDTEYTSQLISRFTYNTGQNWYHVFCVICWGILIASSLSTLFLYKINSNMKKDNSILF